MQKSKFKISKSYGSIILQEDNNGIAIYQGVDNDIFFSTSQDIFSLELNLSSRNYIEWQTYIVFENLMKSIIGRYILNDDNKKDYSILPQDFIDLDNKVITWHSDSSLDNVLKLHYDNNTIKISVIKSKEAKTHQSNAVRIRTDGSKYNNYYQEFIDFFKQLTMLEQKLNESKEINKYSKQRKLSIFNK